MTRSHLEMLLIASPVVQVPQMASTLWLLDDDDDDDDDTTILRKDAVLRGWMTKTEQKHHIDKEAVANLASRKPIVDLPINIPLDSF